MRWQRLHPSPAMAAMTHFHFWIRDQSHWRRLHALHDMRNVTRNTASGNDDVALRQ